MSFIKQRHQKSHTASQDETFLCYMLNRVLYYQSQNKPFDTLCVHTLPTYTCKPLKVLTHTSAMHEHTHMQNTHRSRRRQGQSCMNADHACTYTKISHTHKHAELFMHAVQAQKPPFSWRLSEFSHGRDMAGRKVGQKKVCVWRKGGGSKTQQNIWKDIVI